MSAFASSDDVVARWRPLTDAERGVVDTLIDDASDMIRVRWPDVDQRVTNGSLSEDSLRRVVANMVKRAMLNGATEGVQSQAQGVGPYSLNTTFSNPTGSLYLTAEDARLFDGHAPRSRVGWLA